MIPQFLWTVVVVPVAVSAVASATRDRVPAHRTAWWYCVAAAAVATSAVITLLVLTGLAVASLRTEDRVGWSRADVLAFAGPWLPWLGVVLLFLSVVDMVVRWSETRRDGRALVQLLPDLSTVPDEVVYFDLPQVMAFIIPGYPRRWIAVSTGARAAFDDREFHALVLHERAHLDGDHHAFCARARYAANAHPGLTPLFGAVAYLTERAADEAAIAQTGDRPMIAQSLRTAHASITAGPLPRPFTMSRRIADLMLRRADLALSPKPVSTGLALVVPVLATSSVLWTAWVVWDVVLLFASA